MREPANTSITTEHPLLSADAIRVLLIDDNEDDAMILQATLAQVRGVPFDVDWASNYQQGLQKLKENSHDICLLDYCLGQKTGLHVLGDALKFGCQVPIIMMTGTTDRKIDLEAVKLGAADYVIKGETNPGLLERVIRHARERRKATIEREQLTQQLVDSSRRLGMAEVAADVLHNIGNVLNSLNVSAGLMAQHVREMPIQDVNRTSALLDAHQDDLGTFLTQDRKGQRIPDFLRQLGSHLHDQHAQTCQDLDLLISQIDHVKDIIAAQQNVARTSSIHEPVLLKDLVETALTIHASGFEKYHIALTRDYGDLPQIVTDKQQVLHIVANLIRNAKEAIRQHGSPSPNLTIRIHPHGEKANWVSIQVCDSGVGIRSENLHRIFAQSFPKPGGGQGTSLHQNALAAKNLGGSLTACSEGEGHGATFTLELPVKFLEIPT
ncbi:MAG: response regulator [Nitrospirota bacterium]|nr:response regulator [Nitrospirota bacterium]